MNNLSFSVQTMETNIGGQLKAVAPNADGVYVGMPIAIIGKPSRNNVLYDPQSFVDAITNPGTRFYKSLVGGGLEGEWGHPSNVGMDGKTAVARTMQINEDRVSHNFNKVYSKVSADGKYHVVYGDIIPCGPNKQHLIDAFSDSKRNAAFSLRSLTSKARINANGVNEKKILALITFDSVSTPGFEEASKRCMLPGNESFLYDMDEVGVVQASIEELEVVPDCTDIIGCEIINNQALQDMLETDNIVITTKEQVITVNTDLVDSTGRKLSPFHTLF